MDDQFTASPYGHSTPGLLTASCYVGFCCMTLTHRTVCYVETTELVWLLASMSGREGSLTCCHTFMSHLVDQRTDEVLWLIFSGLDQCFE